MLLNLKVRLKFFNYIIILNCLRLKFCKLEKKPNCNSASEKILKNVISRIKNKLQIPMIFGHAEIQVSEIIGCVAMQM